MSYSLQVGRTKGLCPSNVETFYINLVETYSLHSYHPSQIWNCEESGAQVSQNGKALVLAKTGFRFVHL
jgi:hypothetical protein